MSQFLIQRQPHIEGQSSEAFVEYAKGNITNN